MTLISDKSGVTNKIFFLAIFLVFHIVCFSQERLYLSGKASNDAVLWDFKCNTGRNSGFWSQIPVPSNWELQGYGFYTYGTDRDDYKTNPETGFYKHSFYLELVVDKVFNLVFQGSMTDTHVKINGKLAGAVHQGGYTQFQYDISKLVKKGENLIEVEVSKPSKNESVQQAERIADFWLFGGIYRPVYIDVLPVKHIERIAVDADMNGKLKINAYLKNLVGTESVSAQVFTLDGKPFGDAIRVKVKSNTDLVTLTGAYDNVKLWSHEFPNLYNIKISLKKGKAILHTITECFGFRTFEVRDHDGFYLNGQRIMLKGASMHSFRPETGRALSAKDNLEDIKLMKSLNFNTVRAPCYPPDKYFLDLCDSLGLLVLNELSGWARPLETTVGTKLVKELVVRDVNHPSVIMWGNGNHYSHNAELEDVFLQWDIQKRRPYKNAANNEAWPGENHGNFELIDTRYYPNYAELKERLSGNQIVCPLETLHALYDGGGGAGLFDYWEVLKKSKVGGGLIIWALYDEGIVRTDEGFRVDNQGNKAPDGIVGPHQEKKGSYFAVKEIWSPVQIKTKVIPEDFDGRIPVANDFDFVNLNQCLFKWKYIRFASPEEASSSYRIVEQGELKGPNTAPKTRGNLQIPVSSKLDRVDALELIAYSPDGQELWTWRFMKAPKKEFLSQFLKTDTKQLVKQDTLNLWQFQSGNAMIRFDEKTNAPIKIIVDSTAILFSEFHVVAKTDKGYYKPNNHLENNASVEKSNENYVVNYQNTNGFKNITWTIMPGGILKLDYVYELPTDTYYYEGIGFDMPADNVVSKRWMGEGPYRIYNNRTKGTEINVWQIDKKLNIPGIVYNFPEFEGYFGNWYWAQLHLNNYRTMGLATPQDNLYLGVLKPCAGKEPKFADIHYPENSGIYFFNQIAPIGEKWTAPQKVLPLGELDSTGGEFKGTVYFRFDWSTSGSAVKRFEVEIK